MNLTNLEPVAASEATETRQSDAGAGRARPSKLRRKLEPRKRGGRIPKPKRKPSRAAKAKAKAAAKIGRPSVYKNKSSRTVSLEAEVWALVDKVAEKECSNGNALVKRIMGDWFLKNR